MGRFFPLLLLLSACGVQAQQPGDPHEEIARRVLSTTPLIDGHNDLPWAIRTSPTAPGDVAAYGLAGRTTGQTDIPRLREGMVGGQFWSVYVPPSAAASGTAAAMQREQIAIAKEIFASFPEHFEEVRSSSEVMPAFRSGRIASMLGMEGGHVIENSLDLLREFYDLGARYLTLTHSENTDWADAATATPRHGGLSPFGEEVVREMNRLGMLVDLSHVSAATMHDAIDVSEAPVIFSHSSARGITNVARNVPEDVLRRIPENGGVVMITYVPTFVSRAVAQWSAMTDEERAGRTPPSASIDDVVSHIEHVRDVAGIDHVGLGADYDGIESLPLGLEDVSTYPRLLAELSRRGWSEPDLRKLAGENILRAWAEAEAVAARLQTGGQD
ncbi:MAG TPA: dipeptidase [Longimicrobiaceae bacterium]|nr:dipeptidase [Longimicrobiaceae bacterium]